MSLYILNLFFNSVYPAFYVDHDTGNLGIRGLAGNSVGFSEHLLADEVQPAPGLVVCLTALQQLLQGDPYLEPFAQTISRRLLKIDAIEKRLTGGQMRLADFAQGHAYFGLLFQDN